MIASLIPLLISAPAGDLWQLPFTSSVELQIGGTVTAMKFQVVARPDGSLPLLNASYCHGWDGRRTQIFKIQPATGQYHLYAAWDAGIWPAEKGKGILLTPGEYAYSLHNMFTPYEWGAPVLGGKWIDVESQADYWAAIRLPGTPTSIPLNTGGNASFVATFSIVPRKDGKVPLYELYASSDSNARLKLYKMDPATQKYDLFYDGSSFYKSLKPGIVLEPGEYAQSYWLASFPTTYMVLGTGRYVNP